MANEFLLRSYHDAAKWHTILRLWVIVVGIVEFWLDMKLVFELDGGKFSLSAAAHTRCIDCKHVLIIVQIQFVASRNAHVT
ncbi:hypothetical protein Y032_0002g641 [Ancylostoma ceylanicum]|uniref:Uncharacterized protein n=1 Tax=Ancylostoma ceylanicum TaxID=53326 RepID=A0A016W1M6_9BILA|nr:hypothetical protein Y032_0002g641 [Ancylostoma ceylanicum]